MKIAGFFLLLAGGVLVLPAVALLALSLPRTGFVLAGFSIEVIGIVLVARSHLLEQGDKG